MTELLNALKNEIRICICKISWTLSMIKILDLEIFEKLDLEIFWKSWN